MFTGRCWVSCVLFGAIIFFPASMAIAQDDPFGEGRSGFAEGAVDPAAVAAEALANEKSLPAAELANVGDVRNQDFCRCVGEADSAAVARIEIVLAGRLGSNGMEFIETPLEEVLNLLQDEYGIPIQLDGGALDEIGLDASESVTINLHNISLGSALRLMLKTVNLTSVIHDEVLMITTPEEAEARLSTCVYDVRGFVEDTSTRSIEELMDTIVSCVSTESWAENGGGEAEIRSLKPGLLVISQTQAVHEEINGLLKAIRDMRDDAGGAHDAAVPGAGAEEVVTRLYVLQIKGDTERLGDRVRRMIVQSLPDEQWDGQLPDGQAVMLTVIGDRIVVRQKPSVQDKVADVLTDGGVAAPSRSGEAVRGRGGGRRDAARGGGFVAPPVHEPRVSE